MAIARILTVKNAALSVDVSWDSSAISYFSVIEVNVGIICACAITLRPLLVSMLPSALRSSYANAGYYGPGDRAAAGGGGGGTKKSSRDTMTHADHGIYGLADLEVTKVLNASQEGLTSAAYFEPAHFSEHRLAGPRTSTSITGGGGGGLPPPRPLGADHRMPAAYIRTRSGDIVVTRETTIREETRPASPGSGPFGDKDDRSWLTGSSKDMHDGPPAACG